MRSLVINTYCGSLLLGANEILGASIIGSYEDQGFGAKITKANYGRFTTSINNPAGHPWFIDHRRDWPDQDLTDTIVLAHPPCSAWSQQNSSAAKRGNNTAAFECTRVVLRYAMTNNAAAIAVESVMGALAGGWDVHDHMAEAGGYHVYRILKNSLLMGVPQYRERFWCVFVRKGLAEPAMTWRLSPRFVACGTVLDDLPTATPVDGKGLDKAIDKFVAHLTAGPCVCGAVHGFDEAEVRRIGLQHVTGHKRSGFAKLLSPVFFPGEDHKVVCRRHVSPFTSAQPSVLAQHGFAPVLLGSSLWIYRGAPLTEEGYKAIMGFPLDYVFPTDRGHGMRTYLSKGVCPPVATWVLDNVRRHLGLAPGSPLTQDGAYVKTIMPGRIASFRPSKSAILRKYELMAKHEILEDTEPIPLRDEEDDLGPNETAAS